MLDPGATLRVVLNSFHSDFSASPSPTSRRTAARLRLCVCPQQQFPPTEKQIDQRGSDKQPMCVLLQSAVAQLGAVGRSRRHPDRADRHYCGLDDAPPRPCSACYGRKKSLRSFVDGLAAPPSSGVTPKISWNVFNIELWS